MSTGRIAALALSAALLVASCAPSVIPGERVAPPAGAVDHCHRNPEAAPCRH